MESRGEERISSTIEVLVDYIEPEARLIVRCCVTISVDYGLQSLSSRSDSEVRGQVLNFKAITGDNI